MKYDYSKLKGRIIEICGSQSVFAEKMGLSEHTISKKLNGDRTFKQPDIEKAIKILNLTKKDIPSYFFNQKRS